jgi:hypothetical protein
MHLPQQLFVFAIVDQQAEQRSLADATASTAVVIEKPQRGYSRRGRPDGCSQVDAIIDDRPDGALVIKLGHQRL